MVGCVSFPDVEKVGKKGKGKNEGESAAYDTESNPTISCFRSPSCWAVSLYGIGICMRESLSFWRRTGAEIPFLLPSGKSLVLLWWWKKLLFFYENKLNNLHVFIWLIVSESLRCQIQRLSVWGFFMLWCCYGYHRLYIVPRVPSVFAQVFVFLSLPQTNFNVALEKKTFYLHTWLQTD